jgi:hypothetical protein
MTGEEDWWIDRGGGCQRGRNRPNGRPFCSAFAPWRSDVEAWQVGARSSEVGLPSFSVRFPTLQVGAPSFSVRHRSPRGRNADLFGPTSDLRGRNSDLFAPISDLFGRTFELQGAHFQSGHGVGGVKGMLPTQSWAHRARNAGHRPCKSTAPAASGSCATRATAKNSSSPPTSTAASASKGRALRENA